VASGDREIAGSGERICRGSGLGDVYRFGSMLRCTRPYGARARSSAMLGVQRIVPLLLRTKIGNAGRAVVPPGSRPALQVVSGSSVGHSRVVRAKSLVATYFKLRGSRGQPLPPAPRGAFLNSRLEPGAGIRIPLVSGGQFEAGGPDTLHVPAGDFGFRVRRDVPALVRTASAHKRRCKRGSPVCTDAQQLFGLLGPRALPRLTGWR
jgi:hypothetical protein